MQTKYRHINGKEYRYGYTTGSCAAAAAKAAVLYLVKRQSIANVSIITPTGQPIEISIVDNVLADDFAECSVIKDSGDDPDVTNGIKIFAKARFIQSHEIQVTAGVGIGIVTKKGLQVPIGLPAINPVPMQMIKNEVASVLPVNKGVAIEIYVPEGIDRAKRTFNEKLGIIGGISILGTSGFVVPMSDEAFKDALALELSVKRELGYNEIILTPGNYGLNFIQSIAPQAHNRVVTISNFVGHMLHESVRYGMTKVLLIGHIGKLVKVAGGIFHTHSQIADARREILAAHYFMFSKDAFAFEQIMQCNTSDEAVQYIENKDFYVYLSDLIKHNCEQHVRNKLEVEVMLFSMDQGLLGSSNQVNEWLNLYLDNDSKKAIDMWHGAR